MDQSRRAVLAGGGAVAITALAGCLGDDEDITAEIFSFPDLEDPEDDGGTIMFDIEVNDPPTEVEVVIRALDAEGEELEEHTFTEELEDEENRVGFRIDDIPDDIEEWEYEVEEA